MNLGKRIELRLNELGWERKDLLDCVPELTPQRLSALIVRDSKRCELDYQISKSLGVTIPWLNDGIEPKSIIDDPDFADKVSAFAQNLGSPDATALTTTAAPSNQSAFIIAASRVDRSPAVSAETKAALTRLLQALIK